MVVNITKSYKKRLLTGAEACVRILEKYNIQYAFAYPGTSELLLCIFI